MVRRVLAGIAVASVVSSANAAEAQATPPCGEQCTLVEVATARRETFTPNISLTGAVQPKFLSDIAFRISGKIKQRFVEVGDHVAADQTLAQIEPKDQQANLDTAQAGLASAEALATQAKVAFDRQVTLYKSGYTTRPSYDSAQQQLRTQQAAVESAKAALGTAQEQFGYTDLKPGVAGIVTTRSAETGQVVQAGQTIFTIAQDGPRDAVFQVYEALLTDPPASKTVDVMLESDPRVKATGTVREISPTVDTASGTVKVKVALDSVPPGMSLGAAVIGTGSFKPREAIVLPRAALFRWNDSPAVWMFDPKTNAVTPRVVTIDRYTGDTLVLSAGVAEGDSVVTAGVQFLHPGQVVAVQEKRP